MLESRWLLLVGLSLAALGCGNKSSPTSSSTEPRPYDYGWAELDAKEGGFTVRMPKDPVLDVQQGTHSATSADSTKIYEVKWVVLDPTHDVEGLFKNQLDSVKKEEAATEPKDITLDKHPGKEVSFKKQGITRIYRMYWVSPVFFTLEVGGASPEAQKGFLDSIKLKPGTAPPAAAIESSSASSAATAAPPTGVPICDEAIAAMLSCGDKMGGDVGKLYKENALKSADTFKQGAATPAGKASLEKSCKDLLDAQKTNPACNK